MLLYYCLERSRRRDSRAPSMRAIEKEAYRWADEGIDTLETASYYVQQQPCPHPRAAAAPAAADRPAPPDPAEGEISGLVDPDGFRDDTIRMAYASAPA